jgi:small subunit ribosomal protein S13
MTKEFRYIIRISDTDLDGSKKVAYALTDIKGIGIRLANIIVAKVDVDMDARLGFLSNSKVEEIEKILKNLEEQDYPSWLLNRSKDDDTGENRHLTGSSLILQLKSDIDKMKKIRSWKGFRHSYGLKVRGQRTRTTSRSRKTVGVKRKRREIR